MSNIKKIIAVAGVSFLPNLVLANDATPVDCGFSTAVFSGEIETVPGYDENGDPTGAVQINLDGTYPDEPEPVAEMTMARFDYQSCLQEEGQISVFLDRRQVAEDLLLHNVLENPSQDLIEQEIAFGAQHITTAEEAIDSLKALKNSLFPQDSLLSAFGEFSEAACPASEYQFLKGTEAAGFTRTSYSRIEINTEFLGANFVCPTFN